MGFNSLAAHTTWAGNVIASMAPTAKQPQTQHTSPDIQDCHHRKESEEQIANTIIKNISIN